MVSITAGTLKKRGQGIRTNISQRKK